MNHQQYFLSLLTIPSLLLLSPQISIASTNSEIEVIENQPWQLAQTPNREKYMLANVRGGVAISFAKLGDFDRALEIAQSIENKASVLVPILRSIAIELAAAGQVEQALTISDNQDDASSQGQILEGIVRGLGTRGELTPALIIAESIEDDGQRMLAIKNLALLLIGADKFDKGMEATQFLANSFDTFYSDQISYLRIITLNFLSAEQFDLSFKVAEILNMQTDNKDAVRAASGLRSSIEGKIAISQAEAGNISDALEMAESLMVRDKGYVFSSVAKALVKSGDTDGALELAQSLEEGHLNSLLSHIAFYGVLENIAVTLVEEGNVDEAMELASSFPERQKLLAIADIAEALVEKREFNQAVQLAKSLPDNFRWEVVSIADKLVEKGERGQAMTIAQSLQGKYKYAILASVITSLAEQGNLERAKAMMESFDQQQADRLRKAIADLAHKGSLEPAQQLVQLLPNNVLKALVLTKLANGYIKAGDKESATTLLNQALSVEMLKIDSSVTSADPFEWLYFTPWKMLW